ncbi:hypothetical protein DL546_000933 [Coniochaeta pulveracea]|uniref:Uncharacterized protein n=1 Tax=Coniochaeta pulveracea TaxID=177199 RepID=A0A420XXA4_9PEZI|nr:hypothetical protein DL546_000933 [Coniochaeta pulveracea]
MIQPPQIKLEKDNHGEQALKEVLELPTTCCSRHRHAAYNSPNHAHRKQPPPSAMLADYHGRGTLNGDGKMEGGRRPPQELMFVLHPLPNPWANLQKAERRRDRKKDHSPMLKDNGFKERDFLKWIYDHNDLGLCQ